MIKLNAVDPLTKQAERGIEHEGMSPMDPPEAYAPPGLDGVALADLHPFLRNLGDEHVQFSKELDTIEEVIQSVQVNGFSMAADRAIMTFLEALDRDFVPHSQEEELALFPLLNERLIADGEHSKGATMTTAVDVMRDEHLKAVQLAAVILNFIRIASVLPDEESALIVVNAALREVTNLVELLRLHMFREDNIVFASANRLISTAALDTMAANGRHERSLKALAREGGRGHDHAHDHGHGHDHSHAHGHDHAHGGDTA